MRIKLIKRLGGKDLMSKEGTKEKVVKIVIDCCNLEEEQRPTDITGLSLVSDLKYDSVSFMSLICELEEKLNIVFDDMESLLDNLDNCDKLMEYVLKLVDEQCQKEVCCYD